MSGIYVLIAAAGSGSRSRGSIPKQFRLVSGEGVINLAVRPFLQFADVTGILCVIPDGFFEIYDGFFCNCLDRRILSPVSGGTSRFESVKFGLNKLSEYGPDYVLIHDAARPFCSTSVVNRVLEAIQLPGTQAVVPTIKSTDAVRFSGEAMDKSFVDLVQTPQAFEFNMIHELYNRFEDSPEFSDDASLCDATGIRVTMVEGDRSNKKLTFPEDFEMSNVRTGFGFDAHKFSSDSTRRLYLFGVCIDDYPGLEGHSDADVGIHSLVDAILGPRRRSLHRYCLL